MNLGSEPELNRFSLEAQCRFEQDKRLYSLRVNSLSLGVRIADALVDNLRLDQLGERLQPFTLHRARAQGIRETLSLILGLGKLRSGSCGMCKSDAVGRQQKPSRPCATLPASPPRLEAVTLSRSSLNAVHSELLYTCHDHRSRRTIPAIMSTSGAASARSQSQVNVQGRKQSQYGPAANYQSSQNRRTIYDQNLNKNRSAELSRASFAYIFSEMIVYAQRRVTGITDLEKRCASSTVTEANTSADTEIKLERTGLSAGSQVARLVAVQEPSPILLGHRCCTEPPPYAHPTSSAIHLYDTMAAAIWSSRRRLGEILGKQRRIHDHGQRPSCQHVHQCAQRDEPAQLRRLRCWNHRRRL